MKKRAHKCSPVRDDNLDVLHYVYREHKVIKTYQWPYVNGAWCVGFVALHSSHFRSREAALDWIDARCGD